MPFPTCPDTSPGAAHSVGELYVSEEWSSGQPVPAAALALFLGRLAPGVVRAKGVVALDDGTGVEVQVVGRSVSTVARPAPTHSQLVVISRAGTPSCGFGVLR